MKQFETILKGLECHVMAGCCGADCPYKLRIDTTNDDEPTCSEQLCRDALALIRQQQAQIKELEQTACKSIEELSNRERDIRLYISTRINTLEQDRVNLLHYLGNVAEKDEEDLESDRNKRDGNAEKL